MSPCASWELSIPNYRQIDKTCLRGAVADYRRVLPLAVSGHSKVVRGRANEDPAFSAFPQAPLLTVSGSTIFTGRGEI